MAGQSYSVKMNRRGSLTLPKAVRKDLPDETIFLIRRRDDGVIELQPRILVDPSQAWFWSPEWQQREREADADIAAGRVRQFDDADEMFAALDAESSS